MMRQVLKLANSFYDAHMDRTTSFWRPKLYGNLVVLHQTTPSASISPLLNVGPRVYIG